jgi:hypothetical protein
MTNHIKQIISRGVFGKFLVFVHLRVGSDRTGRTEKIPEKSEKKSKIGEIKFATCWHLSF